MALNTIYQLRAIQSWGTGGKPLECVFFYNHTAGAGGAAQLADDWADQVGELMLPMQCTIVKNLTINVINLGDLSDFEYVTWAGTGTQAQQALPPYAAVGFTMKLNTRAVAKGSKRVSGIPETAGQDGVLTDATYVDLVEDFRVALGSEITTVDDTWSPIVLKRVKTAVVGTVPTKYTYRLPATDGELVIGEITSVLTSTRLTHQVSREV